MLGLLPAATPGAALHVVFSAECTPLFDWHSVGLFYSFYASGQHGNITRLLACSEAEQAKYPKANLEIGPTFVHRNMRDDPLVDEKGCGPDRCKVHSLKLHRHRSSSDHTP